MPLPATTDSANTPTRVAAFGDVHADLHALQSIFDAAAAAGISRFWCLGDFCSGGPQPAQCYDLVVDHCEQIILGNHEGFVLSKVWEEGFTQPWALSAQFAWSELGEDRRDALSAMRPYAETSEVELVHGSLYNPFDDFLTQDGIAFAHLVNLRRPVLLFAHTHRPACWIPARKGKWTRNRPIDMEKPFTLPARALLNPGAGCDGRGARWLELDFNADKPTATWHQTAVSGHNGVASNTPS